jgi:hypothetical protein
MGDDAHRRQQQLALSNVQALRSSGSCLSEREDPVSTLYLVSFVDEFGEEILVGAAATEKEANEMMVAREMERAREIARRERIEMDSARHQSLLRETMSRLARYRFSLP